MSFLRGKYLYEHKTYPKASVMTFSGEYLDETAAYSAGWIYMYSLTDKWDNWPKRSDGN